MGKIYYIMGKSSSGKDTIYKELKGIFPQMDSVTLYTTRPIREGEREGVEYHFVTKDCMERYQKSGKLIEMRTYHTVMGDWRYATIDDGQISMEQKDYLMIGTLESYEKMRRYFGAEKLAPIYIEVEDGERLKRAIAREEKQENPRYDEVCRRFLADQKDFCEENLQKVGVKIRFRNQQKEICLKNIVKEIQDGKL